VQEQPLNEEDAALRDRCELTARQQYPGSRVLVECDARGIVAGVVLPEDGADLEVSAVSSAPHALASEALHELAHRLQKPTRSLRG
jgi:hypothetical protein